MERRSEAVSRVLSSLWPPPHSGRFSQNKVSCFSLEISRCSRFPWYCSRPLCWWASARRCWCTCSRWIRRWWRPRWSSSTSSTWSSSTSTAFPSKDFANWVGGQTVLEGSQPMAHRSETFSRQQFIFVEKTGWLSLHIEKFKSNITLISKWQVRGPPVWSLGGPAWWRSSTSARWHCRHHPCSYFMMMMMMVTDDLLGVIVTTVLFLFNYIIVNIIVVPAHHGHHLHLHDDDHHNHQGSSRPAWERGGSFSWRAAVELLTPGQLSARCKVLWARC